MFAIAEEWPDYIPAVLVGLILAFIVGMVLYDVVREWRGPKS